MQAGRKLDINTLESYEYISFDIFDTLVRRIVSNSKDVFEITAALYKSRYGTEVEQYAERRILAEQSLWEKTAEGCFTFYHIYKELERYYGKEQCQKLASIELEVEKKVIIKNEEIMKLYAYAIEHKKVILTSDMYLDSAFLNNVLSEIGIFGYKKLYVSGEQHASKADGRLFDKINKEIHPGKILHIGDSKKGDYLMPKLKGWSSYLIHKPKHLYFKTGSYKNTCDKLIVDLATNKSFSRNGYWHNLGFSVLGPLLTSYVQWIKENLEKHDINNVVFLARDGYIVDKAFALMYGDKYSSAYMYVSRKSAIIATLDETASLQKILNNFKFRREERFKDVLKRLGVPEDAVEQECDFLLKREDLYAGKYNKELMPYYPQILANIKEQNMLFSEYTKQIFDRPTAVVDVGWHGSIQNCIQKALGNKIKLTGLYLGLEKKEENKEMFLTEKTFSPNMIPFTRGVFETFFTAPHPSTEAYHLEYQNIAPTFSRCKVPENTSEKINSIQEGALNFVKSYIGVADLLGQKGKIISREMISSMFLTFCNAPKLQDAEMVGTLIFNDTVNRQLIDYTPGHVFKNIKAFMQSDWKAGYAKRMFKLALPYGKILAQLNSFRRKK